MSHFNFNEERNAESKEKIQGSKKGRNPVRNIIHWHYRYSSTKSRHGASLNSISARSFFGEHRKRNKRERQRGREGAVKLGRFPVAVGREIWFRNKNRILGITRIGEAIWSSSEAKWSAGVGYGDGRGNISIWGSGTRTEYRGAHYRQKPTTLCHSRGSHYLLFEETFCSKHFVILREITLDRLISTDSDPREPSRSSK